MNIADLILLSFGLSADAFAVAVTNGMTDRKCGILKTLFIGAVFGIFQGIMPALGFMAGMTFISFVKNFGNIIAFVLLSFIGIKMIIEVFHEHDHEDINNDRITAGMIMIQGLLVSIDALASGVSLSAVGADIVPSCAVIALTAFICTVTGVLTGRKFGSIFSSKAQIAGGAVLIIIGIKILAENYI